MWIAAFIIIGLIGFFVGGSVVAYVLHGSIGGHSFLTTLGAIGGAIFALYIANAIEDILTSKR